MICESVGKARSSRSAKDTSAGIAYVAVLILILLITVSGLAFVQLGELEDRLHVEESRLSQAMWAAEGAAEKAAWAFRHLPAIQSLKPSAKFNPFDQRWYADPAHPLSDTDLVDLLNPVPGETFYPGPRAPYYRIADLTGAGTKVLLRVIGSVDSDGDGDEGLVDQDGDGVIGVNDADPQDSNRFLEFFLGLPASLGRDVSVACLDLVDGNGQREDLTWTNEAFRSAKGQDISGFWYANRTGAYQFGTVLSKAILRGESQEEDLAGDVELPRGLFLPNGEPDPAYFADLPMQVFDGDQVFDRATDPTVGTAAGTVLWVNGDVTLRDVNFGTVSSTGGGIGSDWQRSDVLIVAKGDITLENVACNWVGRLVLVGRDIHLTGSWGRWINGILVASGDVHLWSSPPAGFPAEFEWITQWVWSFPSWNAFGTYFFGSVLAGGKVYLHEGGWALLFDRYVINGIMGVVPRTVLMDRFEGDGLGPCWATSGEVTTIAQGGYLQDERLNRAGDSADPGGDGAPEVLRMTVSPLVGDSGEGETARLVLDDSLGGCAEGFRDWSAYSEIDLYMALDNYRRVRDLGGGSTLTTEREAKFSLVLLDGASPPNQLVGGLEYPKAYWSEGPYILSQGDVQDPDPTRDDYLEGRLPRWRRIELKFSDFQGGAVGAFDFSAVKELQFRCTWPSGQGCFRLRWTLADALGSIVHSREIYSRSGDDRLFHRRDGSDGLAVLRSPGDGHLQYLDPSVSPDPVDVLWDADGVDNDGDGDYEDDLLYEDDLRTTLRVDRIYLPGGPILDYGLPVAFPLEVTRWRELEAPEVGH